MAGEPDRDIDAWVDQLAGQQPPADRETEALRESVRTHRGQGAEAAGDEGDRAWQRLRFRLRQERLIAAGAPTWRRWLPAAGVAVLAIALAVPLLMPGSGGEGFTVTYDAAPALRGASEPVEVAVRDPLGSARAAARIALRHAGRPSIYAEPDRVTLDFEAPAPAAADLEKELKREVPQASIQPGFNRLVFRRQP